MNAEAYIDHAIEMAAFLEDREVAHVGDRDKARSRLEARYGIAGSLFWSLRYRPPKQIAVEIYSRLCAAVEDAAERQIGILHHEAAKARAAHQRIGEDAVRKAQALADELKKITDARGDHD